MRTKVKVEGVKLKEFAPNPVDDRWSELGKRMADVIYERMLGESLLSRIVRCLERNRIFKLVKEVVDETTG
jgi:hypothetical protein